MLGAVNGGLLRRWLPAIGPAMQYMLYYVSLVSVSCSLQQHSVTIESIKPYLSSIDMHMQYEMQKDFKPAISIVVDKDNQISAFQLTDLGMQVGHQPPTGNGGWAGSNALL